MWSGWPRAACSTASTSTAASTTWSRHCCWAACCPAVPPPRRPQAVSARRHPRRCITATSPDVKTETRLWMVAGIIGIGILLYLLGPMLTPFIISALLAWLGDPIADKLETWRFPRAAAVLVVFIGTFVILGLLLLLIVPMVSREVAELSISGRQAVAW